MKRPVYIRETLNELYIALVAKSMPEVAELADSIDHYQGINTKEIRYNKEIEQGIIVCTTRRSAFDLNVMLEHFGMVRVVKPSTKI